MVSEAAESATANGTVQRYIYQHIALQYCTVIRFWCLMPVGATILLVTSVWGRGAEVMIVIGWMRPSVLLLTLQVLEGVQYQDTFAPSGNEVTAYFLLAFRVFPSLCPLQINRFHVCSPPFLPTISKRGRKNLDTSLRASLPQ